jgi:bud emergence protein 1
MLNYKANSIALGVLDDFTPPVTRASMPARSNIPDFLQEASPPIPQMSPKLPAAPPPPLPAAFIPEPEPEPEPQPQQYDDDRDQGEYAQPQDQAVLPDGILVSANVVSFHFEMEEFWFRVHALFQPYDPSGGSNLPPARQLVLFRAYNDFYDFQVELLDAFPKEGGREPGFERVLPYMPGPAENVNHKITASRQVELDDYLNKLANLRKSDAAYVIEHELVRAFLAPKPGDVETEVEPVPDELYAYADDPELEDVATGVNGMVVNDPRQQPQYEDYDYDDEAIRQPQQPPYRTHSRTESRNGYEQTTLRPSSSGRNPSPLPPHMQPERNSNGYTNGATNGRTRSGYDQDRQSAYSRASSATDGGPPSAGSARSRSGSSAAAIHSPPISANNPAPAFVKIKVFDAATDDLIAVRVHPRVTHGQLVEKISSRLGVQVTGLKFRSSANAFVGVDDDEALHEWIDTTDKLVLYAD